MKNILLIITILILTCSNVFAFDTYVNGYTKSNGTYVQPHYQTKQDDNMYNNYSTKGNSNPYTGQQGYVEPIRQQNFNSPQFYGSSTRKNNFYIH